MEIGNENKKKLEIAIVIKAYNNVKVPPSLAFYEKEPKRLSHKVIFLNI